MLLFVGPQPPTKNAIAEGTFPSFPMAFFRLPIVGHPWRWAFGAWLQQTICIRQITAATAPIPIQNSGSTSIKFSIARPSFRCTMLAQTRLWACPCFS